MKKKICFVVSQPGTAVSFFKIPMNKLSNDFDIYLVANIKSAKEVEELPLNGYKSLQIERRPSLLTDLKVLYQLFKYFKQEKFFCVHSMSSKPSLMMAIAAFFARTPKRIRIFTGQIWCNMTGLKRLFYKTIDRVTVMLNTDLLADGHPQARYLEEQKIIKPNRIKVFANGSICGIDTEKFKFNQEIRYKVRSEMKLVDKTVFVFLGRLKRDKGIWELMAAFNEIVPECPKSLLLLLGTDEENCINWIKQFPNIKLNENIIFYGFTSRPNDLLMASDIFCMPSYREGFGLSVLEASCLELPVICSDIYGMEDTMVDNVTGLRCKVKDVESLKKCMKELYDDPNIRRKFGIEGHKRVVEDFSQELVSDEWYKFYIGLK